MTQDIPPVSELMQPMSFDMDDLIANRAGQLGDSQRDRLQGLQTRALLIGLAGFFGIGLLAAIFIYFAQVRSSFVLLLLGIFTTMINALFVGLFGRQWMLLNADIRDDEVAIISGTMERVVQADNRMNNFVLRVNGEDFHVKKDLFKLFRHEVPYRLYCAPRSRVLLAAEPTPDK